MASETLTDYAASVLAHTAATVASWFYLINGIPMMALNNADANAQNVFVRECQMLRVQKTTGEAWTVGTKLYLNSSTGKFTTTASGNTLGGYVVTPAASGDTEGVMALRPFLA